MSSLTNYIAKTREIKKNIVQPEMEGFIEAVSKSLEEFGIAERFKSFEDMYYSFKKSKLKYRLSLENSNPRFSKRKTYKSKVQVVI